MYNLNIRPDSEITKSTAGENKVCNISRVDAVIMLRNMGTAINVTINLRQAVDLIDRNFGINSYINMRMYRDFLCDFVRFHHNKSR